MKHCCKTTLENMQGVAELAGALKVFLAASPFILILPDLILPGSSREAIETLGEKVITLSADKVLSNVTKSSALPDFADSVRNVHEIALNKMHQFAQIHSLRHVGGTEGQIWRKFQNIYDENGAIRSSGGGWDLNPFW